jgi:F-type H+-transporting ATPase subunit epsilon
MADLDVALVAADRRVWSGTASSVIVRTTEGDIGVLPGHAPAFSVLVPGLVQVRTSDGGAPLLAAIDGGFLSVSDNRVSLLAETVALAADVDVATAQEELRAAEQSGDADALRRAQARVAVATGSAR